MPADMKAGIASLSLLLAGSLMPITDQEPASALAMRRQIAGKQEEMQAPAGVQPRDKWAVLIGIGEYRDPIIPPLNCSRPNVSSLLDVLKNPGAGKFASDHVLVVTDSYATKATLESALLTGWLTKRALPTDLVFVYLCGRTAPALDSDDVLLLPYDTSTSSGEKGASEPLTLSGIGIKQLLTELHTRIQSPNIICVLDLSPISPSAGLELSLRSIADAAHVTLMSANQLTQPSYEGAADGRSVFSQYLAEGLNADGGMLPLGGVADYIKSQTQQSHAMLPTPQFAVNAANTPIVSTALGCAVKVAPPHKVSVGFPIETLSLTRPDLFQPRVQSSSSSHTSSTASYASDQASQLPPADEEDESDAKGKAVDFGPYMAKMKRDIQSRWHPPQSIEQKNIVAVFSINQDGNIVNPTIVNGTGITEVDNSALEALKATSPLDPLPPGSPKNVQIRYQFDWKGSAH